MPILRGALRFAGLWLPAILVGALVMIVLADVVARNFFAMSIMWAQELSVVLLAATVWLGLVGASMNGQLFGIELFVDRLPAGLKPAARILADLLVMLIAAAVIHATWAQISTARFTKFVTLGWPKWIVAALLALGMALLIVSRLLALFERRETREDETCE